MRPHLPFHGRGPAALIGDLVRWARESDALFAAGVVFVFVAIALIFRQVIVIPAPRLV